MKIRHPSDTPAAAPASASLAKGAASDGPAAAQAHASPGGPQAADASAKVALSSTAATLLASPTSAEFDAQKVARITRAIEDGSFKIDPQAIADKLIANAQELLGRVPS